MNDSRTLVLQLRTFLQPDALTQQDAPQQLTLLAHRQIAWCYNLGESLRGQDPLASLGRFLPEPELAYAKAQNNRPLALLALHAAQLQGLQRQQAINPFQQVQLDSTLVRLCESMGQAERIKSTVFPANSPLSDLLISGHFVAESGGVDGVVGGTCAAADCLHFLPD